jgi:hypothetical protein
MTLLGRISHWAVARLLVQAGVLVITIVLASRLLAILDPSILSAPRSAFAIAKNLVEAVLLLCVYALMIRVMERRRPTELDLRRGAAHLPAGALVGAAMMAAVQIVLGALGLAAFGPGSGLAGLVAGLVAAVATAVFEELLFRGVLFRIVEQACGTTVALIVSAAFFGLAHSFNPGATLFSDVAIAVEAGLMLALAFAATRSLWLAIGIHAGWNFAEGSLFGVQVSGGAAPPSLVHATLHGPQILTGGAFGPEASIVAIAICTLASIVFAGVVIRRGDWRPSGLTLVLA